MNIVRLHGTACIAIRDIALNMAISIYIARSISTKLLSLKRKNSPVLQQVLFIYGSLTHV